MTAARLQAIQQRIGLLSTIDSPILPPILAYLRIYGVNDVLVICDEKTLADRDQEIFRQRIGDRPLDVQGRVPGIHQGNGAVIPFVFVDNHNSDYTRSVAAEWNVDCLVNAGTPRKLRQEIIESAAWGVINVHPGVLPKYRGSSAVEWSILNDDHVGNTAHFMTSEYDAGPIIAIEKYDFPLGATYQDIRRSVYLRGCELTAKVLKQLRTGELRRETASMQNESEARLWAPIPESSMQEVLEKLAAGKYKYQSKN